MGRKAGVADSTLVCHGSGDECLVMTETWRGFRTALRPTRSHDEVLIKATEQINAIIKNIPWDFNNKEKQLSFIITRTGPMLAWVKCEEPEYSEGTDRTEEQTKIERVLGLIE